MIHIIKKVFSLFFILTLAISCAHKSGQFIRIPAGSSAQEVAKKHGLKDDEISQGLEVQEGWVFIPAKKGIIQFAESKYDEKTQDYLNQGKFLWPVPSQKKVSSHFGHRWGKKHDGIDIPAPIGEKIVAAEKGVIIYSGNKIGGYGNITIIQHQEGFYTVYAHAKKNYRTRGESVNKGDVIALVGMTGRSTGPHLHFEIRRNSESLDPRNFLAFNFKK